MTKLLSDVTQVENFLVCDFSLNKHVARLVSPPCPKMTVAFGDKDEDSV